MPSPSPAPVESRAHALALATVQRLAYHAYVVDRRPYRHLADRAGLDVRTLHRALDPARAGKTKLERLALVAWALDLDLQFSIQTPKTQEPA